MRKAALIDIAGNPVVMPEKDTALSLGKPVKTTYYSMDEWRDGRSTTIGGSEASAILGLNPYLSPFELYSLKAGLVEPDNGAESEVLEWGSRLEQPIVEAYQDKTNRKIKRHGIHTFRSPNYPLSVSLDGEIEPIDDRGPGVLEIKTTGLYSEKDLQESVPVEWQIQCNHAMAIMGWRWASLAIFIIHSRKFRYLDIERNDQFIEMLLRKELDFVKRIEDNNPPIVDGSDSTTEVLKRLYPNDSGETIQLPSDATKWDAELVRLKSQIQDAEKRKTELENLFRAALGTATFGVGDDGLKYSWRLQHRDSYYVKESEYRVLRRLK